MPPISDATTVLQPLAPLSVVSAYIFGSHARGTPHAESDLDVGLLFDRSTLPDAVGRRRQADRIRTDLMEALRLDRVDVVVLNDAPPELAKTVVHTGQRVLCRNAEADHAFRRDAQLRYADLRPFLERTRRLKLEALRR
jgi:predicted nucleotidyltransferase